MQLAFSRAGPSPGRAALLSLISSLHLSIPRRSSPYTPPVAPLFRSLRQFRLLFAVCSLYRPIVVPFFPPIATSFSLGACIRSRLYDKPLIRRFVSFRSSPARSINLDRFFTPNSAKLLPRRYDESRDLRCYFRRDFSLARGILYFRSLVLYTLRPGPPSRRTGDKYGLCKKNEKTEERTVRETH